METNCKGLAFPRKERKEIISMFLSLGQKCPSPWWHTDDSKSSGYAATAVILEQRFLKCLDANPQEGSALPGEGALLLLGPLASTPPFGTVVSLSSGRASHRKTQATCFGQTCDPGIGQAVPAAVTSSGRYTSPKRNQCNTGRPFSGL